MSELIKESKYKTGVTFPKPTCDWGVITHVVTSRGCFAAKTMQTLTIEGVGYNENKQQIKSMCSAVDWAQNRLTNLDTEQKNENV